MMQPRLMPSRAMNIRPARTDDAAAMAALITSFMGLLTARPGGAGAEEFVASVAEPAMRGRIAATNFHHLVAEDRGRLVGFVAVRDHAHLFNLFVAESYQRLGLARRLWDAARRHAESQGNPGTFTVNSSRHAQAVYERFGFRPVAPVTEAHGVAYIPMRLESRDNAGMEHSIQHQENGTKGAFYVEKDGRRLAEMSYSRTNATLVIVDHTEVDASLGGQGVGRRLLDALVRWARATGTKVVPLCAFAKSQFDKDPSIRDVLV